MRDARYRIIPRPSHCHSWTTTRQWITWGDGESLFPSVAPHHAEACELCHGATGYRSDGTVFYQCFACQEYGGVLDAAVPIAYSLSDGLESLLHQFKDFRGDYGWIAVPLASITAEFLARHLGCIESRFGPVSGATLVPPGNETRRRNHLEAVLRGVTGWNVEWRMDILTKVRPGRPARGRLEAGFYRAVPALVHGGLILIVDDTWTSGSTIASCAHALKDAGARTVVSVTTGRQLNAGFGSSDLLVDEARRRVVDLDRCMLCG